MKITPLDIQRHEFHKSAFRGLDRRMQRIGTCQVGAGEVVVYDDYGHHPSEIEGTRHARRPDS